MNALRHRSGHRFGRAALVGLLSLLASCGGGGDSPPSPPVLPDLSGVWAGAWQGADPVLGQVGGTWEAEFTQSGTTLAGTVTLLGDVDCMAGQASGAIDAQNQLSGTLLRAPCQLNQWTLTALDVATLAGTGAWTQSGSGAGGSLSGQRVARLVGPRVASVHPPAGGPGTVVTVAGTSLTPGATPVLRFGDVDQPLLLSTSASRWVVRVPAGGSTGSVQLTTAAGSAKGPVMFRTEVATPSLTLAWSLASTDRPAALAFSRDGRKLFVAERSTATGGIAVVHTLKRQQLTRTAITSGVPIALATSPDGRRVFASVAGVGVLVLDGALATVIDTIPLTTIADAGFDNPQGLAVSPDGSQLLVSDGRIDGRTTLLRTADKLMVRDWPVPAGSVPLGVAFSADGGQALVLAAPAAGGAGALLRYDLASGAALTPIAVGRRPVALAVSPDGRSAFVANQDDHTLSRIDLASAAVTHTPPSGGLGPTGIAFSPDGRHVLVANRDDATLSLHGEAEGWPAAPALSLGGSPLGVAIDPQGMAAFAGLGSARAIQAIGGVSGLNVLLGGTGFGSVSSVPAGIQCGTSCLARFPTGSTVRLNAVPGTNSMFVGWSGDPACNGGSVTLLTDTTCVANFASNVPPPQNVPAGGPCFIATAAYGSAMAPQVQLLRDFRDRHLMPHAAGRVFVASYYRHSPAWADAIRPHPGARAAVRALLVPIVFAVEHPAAAAGLALASIGLVGLGLRRRRGLRG